ncbi:OmpH family outer membrane protein [Gammaproteobacteria bacterium]|nr:OmpH family outer membrane protein [Gammaproteobacteria bacterium]
MNKLKLLLLSSLLTVFSSSLIADGIRTIDPQTAILNTQYAQAEFLKLRESPSVVEDSEELELLQTEVKALVERFQKDQETLSNEEIADMQTQVNDKQAEMQFFVQKLQTKEQETVQAILTAVGPTYQQVLGELIQAQELDMVVSKQALIFSDPDFDITDSVTAILDRELAELEE